MEVPQTYGVHVVNQDGDAAQLRGRLRVPCPLNVIDKQIAAITRRFRMTGLWGKGILPPSLRAPGSALCPLWEAALTMALVVAFTLPILLGLPPAAAAAPDPLEQRLLAWPAWSLPAPLPRPGRRDLVWPAWFAGDWEVCSEDAEGEEEGPALHWQARFHADGTGGAVADRAFNARAIGRAALGDQLLSVADDPANPNRQLTRLGGDRLLETTVVGRRSALPSDRTFLADELSLQVLHGPGEPRIQRVEVLGRWQLRPDGAIDGEQWQASYPSPAEGLAATAQRPRHLRLRLSPLPTEPPA